MILSSFSIFVCVFFWVSFFFILSRSMTCSLSLLVRACVCIFLFRSMTHSFSLSVHVFLDMGLLGGGNDFPVMGLREGEGVMGLREGEGERLQYLVLWRRPIFGAIFQDIARKNGLHLVSNASFICNYFWTEWPMIEFPSFFHVKLVERRCEYKKWCSSAFDVWQLILRYDFNVYSLSLKHGLW